MMWCSQPNGSRPQITQPVEQNFYHIALQYAKFPAGGNQKTRKDKKFFT